MEYDIAIVGGGPAGLMAAGRAAELGAKVILLEKNPNPGTKLLLTGGGRCNFTNDSDKRLLAASFGSNGRFLLSALSAFDSEAAISFFEARGIKHKTESRGRVFPASDRSRDILQALIDYCDENKVTIKNDSEVVYINTEGKHIAYLVLSDGKNIKAQSYIICTGGKSYPGTGSTGTAYAWLEKLGHHITALSPAVVPISLSENYISNLEGLSYSGLSITLFADGKKISDSQGEIIFTKDSLSGPASFAISRNIKPESGLTYKLALDFFPETDQETLDGQLQELFRLNSNKHIRNTLEGFLPPKLVPVALDIANIRTDKKANGISREERKAILALLKAWPLTVSGLGDWNKAMVTAGGVDLHEVDPKTMRSRIIDNLYFAGEILDIDGPTGGYNLQACWSTGRAAGEGATTGFTDFERDFTEH